MTLWLKFKTWWRELSLWRDFLCIVIRDMQVLSVPRVDYLSYMYTYEACECAVDHNSVHCSRWFALHAGGVRFSPMEIIGDLG